MGTATNQVNTIQSFEIVLYEFGTSETVMWGSLLVPYNLAWHRVLCPKIALIPTHVGNGHIDVHMCNDAASFPTPRVTVSLGCS